MPVTKTAKRALRGSLRKAKVNTTINTELSKAMRLAKKNKKENDILKVFSLADRAAKKNTIHKNKAARIKSRFSKLLTKRVAKSRPTKKTPKAKK